MMYKTFYTNSYVHQKSIDILDSHIGLWEGVKKKDRRTDRIPWILIYVPRGIYPKEGISKLFIIVWLLS